MGGLVFPAHPVVILAVEGSDDLFPVRRIYCVGRNYADHVREMGHEPGAEPPFFFAKPRDAVVAGGSTIAYPTATSNLHHEAELVVAIGASGALLTEADAPRLIWGYGAGNDLTRRDLQAEAKATRRPWDMAKGFDRSAVIGPLRKGPLTEGGIRCTVNGVVRQAAQLSDMIWSVPAIIASLSQLVTLAAGDLIFTGTPAGVGPLLRGDTCTVEIDGLKSATVRLV